MLTLGLQNYVNKTKKFYKKQLKKYFEKKLEFEKKIFLVQNPKKAILTISWPGPDQIRKI